MRVVGKLLLLAALICAVAKAPGLRGTEGVARSGTPADPCAHCADDAGGLAPAGTADAGSLRGAPVRYHTASIPAGSRHTDLRGGRAPSITFHGPIATNAPALERDFTWRGAVWLGVGRLIRAGWTHYALGTPPPLA